MAIALGNIEIADLRLGASQVKALCLGSEQIWGGEEPTPVTGPWLCFTAAQANSTVHFDKKGSPGAISIETSTDGSTWTDYSWTDKTGDTVTLANVGDKVYFRAKTENTTLGDSLSNNYKFSMTGKIAASGSIQTLLKADGSRTDAPAYCFMNLFEDNHSLTTAPELPATTLADGCYWSVFKGCTLLTTAPKLPATNLATQCYQYMFLGSGITAAPELPATTLASSCYSNMFSRCLSLTTAPELPATTLADGCYTFMFKGCSSLTTAPELPATTLADGCYSYMFQNCTSLSSVEVAFTEWTSGATSNWLDNVAASGTFTCPAELPDERSANKIPEGWTIEHPPQVAPLLHFDGIDNTGAGDASHSTSTRTWANVASNELSGYTMQRNSSASQTDWDSKGAVFTGDYNQCFWLYDGNNAQVAQFGNVLSGSFTYTLALYFDPTTMQNYRGYVGKEGNSGWAGAYVICDANGVCMRVKVSAGTEVTGSSVNSYMLSNDFNTIAFSYNQDTLELKSYVNGVLVDTTATTGVDVMNSNQPLTLGGGVQSWGSNRVCKGKIYDFRVYAGALDDADISDINDELVARYNT